MKAALQIILAIFCFIIIGCRTKIVCGFPGIFEGEYKTFIEAGIYDIEYRYSGCNPMILRNVKLSSGEIKDAVIRLGLQGKEITKYEIDLIGK
jgi:hypothetical protein